MQSVRVFGFLGSTEEYEQSVSYKRVLHGTKDVHPTEKTRRDIMIGKGEPSYRMVIQAGASLNKASRDDFPVMVHMTYFM